MPSIEILLQHKIAELRELTEAEKSNKIRAQSAHNLQVLQAQRLMDERREHAVVSVLTEEEWLQELQDRAMGLPLGFTVESIAGLGPEALEQLFDPYMLEALEEELITIADIVRVNQQAAGMRMNADLLYYLNTPSAIERINDGAYTIADMMRINSAAQNAGIDSSLVSDLNSPEILHAITTELFTIYYRRIEFGIFANRGS